MRSFLLAVGLAVLLPISLSAQAPADKAGEVSALLPVGRIQRGASPPAEAKLQDAVQWQDWFETAAQGRARLALVDGSQINVGSEARFQVLRPQIATQQTEVELQFGKIRNRVAGAPGKRFEVRTDSAVVGVIGTHFYISRAPGLTTVINLDGKVTVRNADTSVSGEETLEPFELAEIEPGKPPRKRWATLEEIRRALEDTLPGPVVQLEPWQAAAGSCVSAVANGIDVTVIEGDITFATKPRGDMSHVELSLTIGAVGPQIASRGCGGPDIQPVQICVPENAQPGIYDHPLEAADGTAAWAGFLVLSPDPTGLQDAWLVYADPLPLGATHTARLLGAEEKPLAGVTVHIRQGGEEKIVTTDAEGGFVIEARQLGAVEVEVPRTSASLVMYNYEGGKPQGTPPFEEIQPIKVTINVVEKVEEKGRIPEFAQRGSLITVKGELESAALGDRRLPLLKTVLRGGGILTTFAVPRQMPEGARTLSLTEPGRAPRSRPLFVYEIVGSRLDQRALISGNVTAGEFLVCTGMSGAQTRKLRARITAVGPVQFRGQGGSGKRFEQTFPVSSSGLLRIPFQIQAEKTGSPAAIPFTLTLVLSEN